MSSNNWLIFALDDIDGAKILLREKKYSITCFHAQQAAEKALKGFLVHNKISPPRTHNLVELINLCSKIDDGFLNLMPQMAILNQFYAPTRYPDAVIGITSAGMPSMELAQKALSYSIEAVQLCKDKIDI